MRLVSPVALAALAACGGQAPLAPPSPEELSATVAVQRAGDWDHPQPVALLPWAVFGIRQWRLGDSAFAQVQLEKHHWTREPREVDVPGSPFELSQRYVTVSWWYL